MRPTNVQLALSLEQLAQREVATTDPVLTAQRLQVAQGLLDYPSSRLREGEALRLLGIDPTSVPAERWPSEPQAYVPSVRSLSVDVDALASGWDGGTPVHRLLLLRRLRWSASMAILALEQQLDSEIAQRTLDNKGSVKGIISKVSDHRQGRPPTKKRQAVTQQARIR